MNLLKEFSIIHDNIKIKPILSVDRIAQEEKIMKHCVFTNTYFTKKDSYLFTSFVNNKPAETIEYSKKEKRILQHGGYDNNHVPECKIILNIFKEHIPYIDKLLNLPKKRNANTRSSKLSANRTIKEVASCNPI